jgi:CheY-like chemotaxis protein
VLIVDDYQDCCDMYGAYLSLAGFDVLTANDGAEALRVAKQARPDVILMDLGLPGIDGCEATRQLKSDPSTRVIPVLALTAQNLPGNAHIGRAGFDGVISKPCLPDELAERVARIIEHPPSFSVAMKDTGLLG